MPSISRQGRPASAHQAARRRRGSRCAALRSRCAALVEDDLRQQLQLLERWWRESGLTDVTARRRSWSMGSSLGGTGGPASRWNEWNRVSGRRADRAHASRLQHDLLAPGVVLAQARVMWPRQRGRSWPLDRTSFYAADRLCRGASASSKRDPAQNVAARPVKDTFGQSSAEFAVVAGHQYMAMNSSSRTGGFGAGSTAGLSSVGKPTSTCALCQAS